MHISYCKVKFVTLFDVVIFSHYPNNETKVNILAIIKKKIIKLLKAKCTQL